MSMNLVLKSMQMEKEVLEMGKLMMIKQIVQKLLKVQDVGTRKTMINVLQTMERKEIIQV